MIFQIDKTIYEQLSETERYIVDFISQNEDKISYLSITNIADKTLIITLSSTKELERSFSFVEFPTRYTPSG